MAKRTRKHLESAEQEDAVSVLIVDSEELLLKSCSQILSGEGYTVLTATGGNTAQNVIRQHHPDVVITELMLPDMDGLMLLREIKRIAPRTLVIVITGFATVDSSVECIRAGAYDYIPKPFTATQLRILIGRAAQRVKLVHDNTTLRDELQGHYSLGGVVGKSDIIRKIIGMVSRVAKTDASVLISGETGTGKNLIARLLHVNSHRFARPFYEMNCAGLPMTLLEVELFGHEKGAFTGAQKLRRGLLELASGGTLLLDEISEIDIVIQYKLLQAIQEQKIRRVGGELEIPIDIRWISTTSRDLEQALQEKALRKDLLNRLSVVSLKLPPLCHRREDIPLLAQHFLEYHAQRFDRENIPKSCNSDGGRRNGAILRGDSHSQRGVLSSVLSGS